MNVSKSWVSIAQRYDTTDLKSMDLCRLDAVHMLGQQ